jgi:hypothetical protein
MGSFRKNRHILLIAANSTIPSYAGEVKSGTLGTSRSELANAIVSGNY